MPAKFSLCVRPELESALNRVWSEISQVGAWLSSGQRLAIANEARSSWQCELCKSRKKALSPYAVKGEHDHTGALPEAWVEAVHRIVTDPGRITETWYHSTIAAGILEDEFIELLSLATVVTGIDTLMRATGLPLLDLPATGGQGRPARRRPSGAKSGPGWARTVGPEDAGPDFGNFYEIGPAANIRRALTLVPEEVGRIWPLFDELYLNNPNIVELEGVDRAITRGQMEFAATRASAYLDCFY